MKNITFALLIGLCVTNAYAQQALPVPAEIQQAFKKGTRDASGRPGKSYWQNSADYDLKVDFDPGTRLLSGQVSITYFNNSPDTLKQLWFKLYPNLFKKGVRRKAKIALSDQNDGVDIKEFKVGPTSLNPDAYVIDGTNMSVNITPLFPGKSLKISMSYDYILNKGSHTRTGEVDKGSYFLAYFFPRVSVYDDVDGWNKYPYTGEEEFYNDFGNYKVEITVPKKYVVWATGDLKNANKVLSKRVAERLQLAETSDSVVNVISNLDIGNATAITQAKNTFKYEASNVTDFAFALSDHYLWKSTSVVVDSTTMRRVRVDAAFNSTHQDYYEVVDFAKQSVSNMSHSFPKWPFPYAHETIFDGLDQMEYPMIVNDNPVKNREDAITLTVHEIFHTMFPFYMGINETKYAWMDEGWATIGEWEIGPKIDSTMVDTYGVEPTANSSGRNDDTPIMTLTTELQGAGIFTNSYPKPAMGYSFIRDYLGNELFTKALHHYVNTWKGKHPTPFDFFNSMNEGAGKNMNWFWKRWFFEGGITDLAISTVTSTNKGYEVLIQNKSNKPLPVDLLLTYTDGSKENIHKTISVWEGNESSIIVPVPTVKKLKRVFLGSAHTPDKNKNDNFFNF
jgi:hypothetical protein